MANDIIEELNRVADITPARKKLLKDAAVEIGRQRGLANHYRKELGDSRKRELELELKVEELERKAGRDKPKSKPKDKPKD